MSLSQKDSCLLFEKFEEKKINVFTFPIHTILYIFYVHVYWLQDAHELQQTLCSWFETLATLLDETRVRMQHCLTPVALTFNPEIPSLPMLDFKTTSCLSLGDVPISQSVDQKCFINLSFVSVLFLAHQPLPQSEKSLIELARLYRNCNSESLDEIRTLYQIQVFMMLLYGGLYYAVVDMNRTNNMCVF